MSENRIILRCGRILPMEIRLPEGYQIQPAPARGFVAVAADGAVIGQISMADMTLGETPVRTLTNLSVAESHRRKGVGAALCKTALRSLRREDNASPVFVLVQPENEVALHLFTALGFSVVEEGASSTFDLSALKWNEAGLIPAIAQDASTGEVLMLAWMNQESLRLTMESGYATYYSRSRQQLWRKGETSGHTQRVIRMMHDCDGDAILMQVNQIGPACHTGKRTCFHNPVLDGDLPATADILNTIEATIADRAANPKPGSYTNYLLDKGPEKICKKVGEEATETVIAAMKNDADGLAGEAADLLYHLAVLLHAQGVPLQDVWEVLKKRHT